MSTPIEPVEPQACIRCGKQQKKAGKGGTIVFRYGYCGRCYRTVSKRSTRLLAKREAAAEAAASGEHMGDEDTRMPNIRFYRIRTIS